MSSSPVEFSIAPAKVDSTDPYRERRPPYSEDAEQAVLSAMLNDMDAILVAVESVDDTMFYAERHRRIFRAMVAIVERGAIVDPVTLGDELTRRGELQSSGGKEYIGFLIDVVPTAANVAYHAQIVRQKAILRSLIEVSTSIVHDAFEGKESAAGLLDTAESRIFEVSRQKNRSDFTRVKELTWAAMERIEQLHQGKGALTGVTSGFRELDELTAGFQPSDLIIVAARPSMGKTAFTLNVAVNAATVDPPVPTAIFSLEMSKASLVQRMITSEARVDAQNLRRGMLRDDEYPNLARAAGILSSTPIWIDDTPSLTLLEMRSKARRLVAESQIGLIVVDYLQLMQGPHDVENRQQEISAISRGLKALAKELQVPVIALSQLSRAPELRADKRPLMSDLRESGAIEQDADLVMALYRPEVYPENREAADKEGKSIEGAAEVILLKQRNGPIGTVNLRFSNKFTRFDNLDAKPFGFHR